MKHKLFKKTIWWIAKAFIKIMYNIEYLGEKEFPKTGAHIICPNHIHTMDIPTVACFGKGKRWTYFMAKKEFFDNWFLNWFFSRLSVYPVDRENADIVSFRKTTRYLKDGQLVVIFPQGTRDTGDTPLPAKKGPAMFAAMTGAKIVPILIEGKFKFRSKIKVYIGKPFDLGMKQKTKYTKQEYYDKSQEIMKVIYSLPEVY